MAITTRRTNNNANDPPNNSNQPNLPEIPSNPNPTNEPSDIQNNPPTNDYIRLENMIQALATQVEAMCARLNLPFQPFPQHEHPQASHSIPPNNPNDKGMAKVHDIVPEPEPEESTRSEEEEEADNDEEDFCEGDSGEERTVIQIKIPNSLSSSSEEDKPDTDSDSLGFKLDSNVKCIVSKPVVDDPQKSLPSLKKPRSKPSLTVPTTLRKGAEKCCTEKECEAKLVKKPKKKGDLATEDKLDILLTRTLYLLCTWEVGSRIFELLIAWEGRPV